MSPQYSVKSVFQATAAPQPRAMKRLKSALRESRSDDPKSETSVILDEVGFVLVALPIFNLMRCSGSLRSSPC
jgi:hypothetical protein